MKIVVIGCAPTGLGLAYRLNEIQASNEVTKSVEIIVLEKESVPGGLSATVTDENGFLWDMGGHITFNHNFPYYEQAVTSAVREWNRLKRNCQVDLNYMYGETGIHLVPYPAQYAIPLFPEKIKVQCLQDLKKRQNYDGEHPSNFDEWVLQHFGPTIRDYFFRIYTKKVWTVDASEMNPNWVGTRVAKLQIEKLEELCSANADDLKNEDFGWGPNAYFTYPKYGGTGAVWKAVSGMLPKEWFHYNSEVTKIDAKNKRLVYTKKKDGKEETREIDYDILVSTMPIDQLTRNIDDNLIIDVRYNKVFIIGVGLRKPMPDFLNKFTWLYFPDPAVPFFRVTMFSRYGEVTPNSDQYWSIMCECARSIDDQTSENEIRAMTLEGLIKKSIIQKDQVVSVYSILLPYGYPIPTVERDSALAQAHSFLEQHNIFSRGRFGGWKYECSNQDHCFMQGKELIDRIILNEHEKVYKTGLSQM